jgi:hypothetical protein
MSAGGTPGFESLPILPGLKEEESDHILFPAAGLLGLLALAIIDVAITVVTFAIAAARNTPVCS